MAILFAILGVAYPLLVLASLTWLEPRTTAMIVLAVAALRFAIARPTIGKGAVEALWLPALGVGIVVAITLVWNDPIGLLLAPVLMNVALLATFGLSLRRGRPMVERFARLQIADLPEDEVRYCRNVTQVWCVFFVVNGGICLALAWLGDLQTWTLYTGFLSYVLIGMLFAAEYVYRHWRFRRYRGGWFDPLLMRVFPPGPSTGD